MTVAAAAGLPAGLFWARRPRYREPILSLASIAQTVPSLALFGFLIPWSGIGARTATIALVLYAMLPILRNTVVGLNGIDGQLLESADALGLTPRQRLWWVELPLAAPSILAGLRIATVTTIGTATIAAAIGAGGLGELIFRGVATVDSRLILAGAIPAAGLALLFEGGFSWMEKRLYRASSLWRSH